MATTQQIREMYDAYACKGTKSTLTLHSGAKITVLDIAADAFRAIDMIMQEYGYHPRPGDTGAYNCRRITGGTKLSLHAYGIAVDYNWNTNPYRRDNKLVTDMPASMVGKILNIKNTNGHSLFRWGGNYVTVKDAMHYEIIVPPFELTVDWDTVDVRNHPILDTQPLNLPVLQEGDKGPSVEYLQRKLNEVGIVHSDLVVDGHFGPKTLQAVKAYQRARKLTVDGIVGNQTWTSLNNNLPPIPKDDPSPVKNDTTPEEENTAPVEEPEWYDIAAVRGDDLGIYIKDVNDRIYTVRIFG